MKNQGDALRVNPVQRPDLSLAPAPGDAEPRFRVMVHRAGTAPFDAQHETPWQGCFGDARTYLRAAASAVPQSPHAVLLPFVRPPCRGRQRVPRIGSGSRPAQPPQRPGSLPIRRLVYQPARERSI